MPAKSSAQFRFMKAVESGSLKVPGLSRKEAKEFTENQSPSGLPDRISAKKMVLRKMRGKRYE